MSIKYKIFLVILGVFLTSINVLADCIITNNNFNKSSKIIFVNPNNGSDQLAKTYSLDNVRNPYEAKNVAAFQSIERAKSLAEPGNGDLILIKAGPKWTNYNAWEGNKLSEFNKEAMKARLMSQRQCQQESLTWVPSAVTDDKLIESTVITDFENKDELILSSTEEATPISLPNITSKDNISASSESLNRAINSNNLPSSGQTRGGNSSGASIEQSKLSRTTLDDKLNNYPSNQPTKKIAKITNNGQITYSDATVIDEKQDYIDREVEIIDVDTGVSKENTESDINNTSKICRNEKMGVNLAGAKYYSTEMILNDIARYSGQWLRDWSTSKDGLTFSLDDDGYIDTLTNPMFINNLAQSKGGTAILTDDAWGRDEVKDRDYVLLYDGDGDIEFGLNAPKVISSSPGIIHIKLQSAGRTTMTVKSTSDSNHIRNIKVIPKAEYEKSSYNYVREDFKSKWEHASVFRYLDALAANNSEETHWNDRASETGFGQGRLSYEDIIRISNETNTDPWITIPHLADDNYVRNLATLFKNELNPSLKVYVEYSNEAWNASFSQYNYLKDKADARGGSSNIQYGLESKRVFEIWMNVYGTSYRNKIVRVIGAQFANPWNGSRILQTEGLAEVTDAIAVGYYIGADYTLSLDGIFENMLGERLDKARSYLRQYKQIADDNGLKLVAYEAGQHLVKPYESEDITNKLITANRDPRMSQVYTKMYETWVDNGGDLIVWFQSTGGYTKWGSWGLLENMGQKSSPKYDAVKQLLSECR